MEVICIEDLAFYTLIEKVVARVKGDNKEVDRWISDEEAMRMLRITSKTTLQKLRDTDQIRFSQPAKKHIVYDAASINDYLNRHSNIHPK